MLSSYKSSRSLSDLLMSSCTVTLRVARFSRVGRVSRICRVRVGIRVRFIFSDRAGVGLADVD